MNTSRYQNQNNLPKIKVVFCGLDQKVFKLLSEENKFNLVAVNAIMEFSNHKTNNPINYLFKWVYQYCLNRNNKNNYNRSLSFYLMLIIFQFFKTFSFLSSRLYLQYMEYLDIILKNNIILLDFNQAKKTQNYFKKEKIDLLVVSNWWLLPDEIIYTPTFKTVNIHPSKLPKYRGSVPTLWALKNNDNKIAVSFMVLDSAMDSGALISQYEISIAPKEDSISLEKKSDDTIQKYLITDLLKYINGEKKLIAQNTLEASITPKYYPYMKIDWNNESAIEIVNKIKLYPHLWPNDQCFTFCQDRKIRFKSASQCLLENSNALFHSSDSLAPGEFIIKKSKIFIKAKDSLIFTHLFFDISYKDSLFLLMQKKRHFISDPKGA